VLVGTSLIYQQQDKTITVINIPDVHLLSEKYTREVYVTTMAGNHPEGLLRLLENRGFTEQKTKSTAEANDKSYD
jgi:hypothetical protein